MYSSHINLSTIVEKQHKQKKPNSSCKTTWINSAFVVYSFVRNGTTYRILQSYALKNRTIKTDHKTYELPLQ